MQIFLRRLCPCLFLLLLMPVPPAMAAAELVDTAARVKPAIVAIGTLREGARRDSPPAASRFLGTGFAIADGKEVVTSLHVVEQSLQDWERLAVISGRGQRMVLRHAVVARRDALHDLAVLRIGGDALPVLTLGDSEYLPEGSEVAFTGFPLGVNTGVYPVTHRGAISAVTPMASPVTRSENLSSAHLRAVRDGFMVYQLDGTVLPGHSGSPVYDVQSGTVVGVVLGLLSIAEQEGQAPRSSGISYVVPVSYLHDLLAGPGSP